MELTVGILSGGKSRRMGTDKAFLTLDSKTFLDRLIEEMSCYQEVLIAVDTIEKYRDYQSLCVEDEYLQIGPIEGIRQILRHAANEVVFIGAVDMPYLNREVVEALRIHMTDQYDCCILTAADGIHPLCGFYRKSMLPYIDQAVREQTFKLKLLLERCNTNYVPLEQLPLKQKILKNINNRNEYLGLEKK